MRIWFIDSSFRNIPCLWLSCTQTTWNHATTTPWLWVLLKSAHDCCSIPPSGLGITLINHDLQHAQFTAPTKLPDTLQNGHCVSSMPSPPLNAFLVFDHLGLFSPWLAGVKSHYEGPPLLNHTYQKINLLSTFKKKNAYWYSDKIMQVSQKLQLLLHWSHILLNSLTGRQETFSFVQFSSVAQLCPTLWDARPPCPSPTPGVHPDSCPLSRWFHPTISSSVITFSSCPQSFPASGSFQMTQLFATGGQSIGVSASTSVLPMNTQDWSLGWTGWISLQSKGLSRVFSNPTIQKHQFFGTQLSL